MSNYDSYKERVFDLTLDLNERDSRIKELEASLQEERRLHAQTKLQVQAVKQDKARIVHQWRQDVDALKEPTIPSGDERGYTCECGQEIEAPFEQRYCSWCGAQFDWSTRPLSDDEWLYYRMKDEAVMAYDAC